MLSSIQLATDVVAASRYNQSRYKDHTALSLELQESNYDLGYVRVTKTPSGILVGDVLCSGITCALAFILNRFW